MVGWLGFPKSVGIAMGWDCGGIVSSFVLQTTAERVDNASTSNHCQ